MSRFLQIAGLVIGLAGLVLQFCISIPASMEAGRSLLGSIVFLFSFFTILTNIGAVLVYTSLLSSTGYAWLPAFAGFRMRAGIAVSITLVFIVNYLLLAIAFIYDWTATKRVHPAYQLAAFVFVAVHVGVLWAFASPAWLSVAKVVTA